MKCNKNQKQRTANNANAKYLNANSVFFLPPLPKWKDIVFWLAWRFFFVFISFLLKTKDISSLPGRGKLYRIRSLRSHFSFFSFLLFVHVIRWRTFKIDNTVDAVDCEWSGIHFLLCTFCVLLCVCTEYICRAN